MKNVSSNIVTLDISIGTQNYGITRLKHVLPNQTRSLFARLISHQPTVLFSQNKPVIGNQPAVLFSQNKPAPAHQPTEHAAGH
jgi:hypothetical protein